MITKTMILLQKFVEKVVFKKIGLGKMDEELLILVLWLRLSDRVV